MTVHSRVVRRLASEAGFSVSKLETGAYPTVQQLRKFFDLMLAETHRVQHSQAPQRNLKPVKIC